MGGDLSFPCNSNVQPRLRNTSSCILGALREAADEQRARGKVPPEEPERPEFESQLYHLLAVEL